MSVTSCNKDDVEDPGNDGGDSGTPSRIVGTWYNSKSANDYDLKYVFNADGTGKGYKGYKGYGEIWDIAYRYDEITGKLTLIEIEESDIDNYLVEFFNNDTAVIYEIHDDGIDRENPKIFKRVK